MGNKLYVGNLPFSITEGELRDLFEPHGTIESLNVIMDRDTGRPRGFAFVEFADAGSADKAQRALDGQEVGDHRVYVPQKLVLCLPGFSESERYWPY